MSGDDRVYLPRISNYAFAQVHPYNQYRDNEGIAQFFENVNVEIRETLQQFFEQFAANIALREKVNLSRTYSYFYLLNYFGLSPIPDPNSSKFAAKHLYDDTPTKYDSLGTDYNIIRYDELLSTDQKFSSYLTADEWAAIAVVMLDYSYEVKNLDFVCEIVSAFYKMNTQRDLNLTTLKFSVKDNGVVKISFPNSTPEEAQMWQRLILINAYNPQLIGLPYGNNVEFELSAN